MKKSFRFVVLAFLFGGGCAFAYAWAQETTQALPGLAPSVRLDPPSVEEAPPPRQVFDGPAAGSFETVRVAPAEEIQRAEMHAFHEAIEKLRSAKDDAEREPAKKELTQLLDQSFSRDLERREHEVSEIESRVKKLREQIEKRKKAKEEIIGLRLKTIVNEVEGLGFPGPLGFERPPGFGPGLGGLGGGFVAPSRRPPGAAPHPVFAPVDGIPNPDFAPDDGFPTSRRIRTHAPDLSGPHPPDGPPHD
jgi:hypothetical protein